MTSADLKELLAEISATRSSVNDAYISLNRLEYEVRAMLYSEYEKETARKNNVRSINEYKH